MFVLCCPRLLAELSQKQRNVYLLHISTSEILFIIIIIFFCLCFILGHFYNYVFEFNKSFFLQCQIYCCSQPLHFWSQCIAVSISWSLIWIFVKYPPCLYSAFWIWHVIIVLLFLPAIFNIYIDFVLVDTFFLLIVDHKFLFLWIPANSH